MFLEYAHYLPERSSFRVVTKMKELVAAELAGVDLRDTLSADAVIEHMTAVNEGKDPLLVSKTPSGDYRLVL